MKTIKVLGPGCSNCQTTARLIEAVIDDRGARDLAVEKVEDIQAIVRYGVLSTPAVVIDEEVVHSGGIPRRAEIESWIEALVATP